MKRAWSSLFVTSLLTTAVGCAPLPAAPSATPAPVTLTIFAAASLTDAFNEVKTGFEAMHPGVTIAYNFGGSNALAQQLGEGAPADVFASANKKQMDIVIDAGRVVTGTTQIFARNRLVVIVPKDNPGKVETLPDLARPGLKIVLAAQEVPVGQYALDFLDRAARNATFEAAYKDMVLANVVSFEDNVRSVLTKIALGEGDAGIVYTSDVSGEAAEDVISLEIPDALNTIATYPIGAVKDGPNPDVTQAFIDYVLSADGQAILKRYGFLSP